MNWLKKRLKSFTIKATVIAPTILAFMEMYSGVLREFMGDTFPMVLVFFAAIAWRAREVTTESLEDK